MRGANAIRRRLELSQLPGKLFHKAGTKYVEYEYGDPNSNQQRLVAWHQGTLIPLGALADHSVEVSDEHGNWHRELKFVSEKDGTKTRLLVQHDGPALKFEEVALPPDLHRKVISNSILNGPVFYRPARSIFYLAEAFRPKMPESNLADLVATPLFNYRENMETYGEGLDVVSPKAFVLDLETGEARALETGPGLVPRKLLPLVWDASRSERRLLVHGWPQTAPRKLGMLHCVNRPSRLDLLCLNDTCDSLLEQHTLLQTPFLHSDGTRIASISSPMAGRSDDSNVVVIVFLGTDRPGEHLSGMAVYRGVWKRGQEGGAWHLASLQQSRLGDGRLLFPRQVETRRCVFEAPLRLQHLPNFFSELDGDAKIVRTTSLGDLQPLASNFAWPVSAGDGGDLFVRSSLLCSPQLVVVRAGRVSTETETANLPRPAFVRVPDAFEVSGFAPWLSETGDAGVVVRRRDAETARRVLMWIHGGPNSLSSAFAFSPLLALLLETLQIDLLLLPNYRGSLTNETCYTLAGAVGDRDVEDCVAALAGCVDLETETEVVVGGGSHGGFLAAHLLTHPRLQRCLRGGIVWNGVLDLLYTYRSSDIPDWSIFQPLNSLHDSPCRFPDQPSPALPDDWQARLHAQSPISKVDRVSVPVCVLVGLKDLRVPPAQSLRYAERLGDKCRLFVYPEDGHALAGPRTAFHRDMQILDFLQTVVGWPAHPEYAE